MIKIFNTLVLFLVSLNIYSIEVLEVEILDSYQLKKEFPGKLLPVEQSKLAFEIPGKIKYIYVDVGDKVEKGQILAKLDDREANARLNQAKASYELSVQVFDRFEDLRQQGHISIQDLDKARSDLTIAESQYEFYKVKLEQTNLMSPYSGIIQSRFLDSGTVISHISVPVLYLNDMEIGNEYDFEVDGKKTKAEFSRLAPMSPGGSDSRLAIFKFNSFVNPGSIAKLNIKINKQSRGTWVPLRSLSQSDQGLWALYTINEENTVVRDLVEIVYFEDQYAFVNGTIKDGDLIVLGGATKIIPGKKID